MIDYFGNDVKRINHALKVYGFAMTISGNENVSRKEGNVIGLAAILHDIGIKEAEKKYNSSAGKYQELEGPPIAERLMLDAGVDDSVIERVCFLIGNHHTYNKIDSMDFQILVEADFLVNIEEEGIRPDSVKSIKDKYFRTETGNRLVETIYGI